MDMMISGGAVDRSRSVAAQRCATPERDAGHDEAADEEGVSGRHVVLGWDSGFTVMQKQKETAEMCDESGRMNVECFWEKLVDVYRMVGSFV